MKNKAKLTVNPVGKTIFKLAFPMMFGMLSIVIYNLADTFFVGKLGKEQLAALTFTFPIIMALGSISFGLGMGASTVISKAVGAGDHERVKRLTSDILLLAVILAAIFALTGILTIEVLFHALGAEGKILEYVKEYMYIWYLGCVFVVVPMVGNNTIRALGDTKTPSFVMTFSGVANFLLDPLLIFGLGPVPAFGVRGAAIATVLARASTFVVAVYVLYHREKILSFRYPHISKIIESWKSMLVIAVPEAFTRMVHPVANGIITKMVAGYGASAVAGFGVATRVEFFALIPITSVSSIMGPFTGQNLGAGKIDRVKKGVVISNIYSILSSLFMFGLFFVFSSQISSIFNSNAEVIESSSYYMKIVSAAYGFYGIVLISGAVLNVFGKPVLASMLNLIQMMILYIPIAYILSQNIGLKGIFFGRALAFFLTSILSVIIINKIIKKRELVND